MLRSRHVLKVRMRHFSALTSMSTATSSDVTSPAATHPYLAGTWSDAKHDASPPPPLENVESSSEESKAEDDANEQIAVRISNCYKYCYGTGLP